MLFVKKTTGLDEGNPQNRVSTLAMAQSPAQVSSTFA
jgi:hypothetical protein